MSQFEAKRPSIATIFNPRMVRTVNRPPTRPSVVVTDEDTPGPPLQLTNGDPIVGTRLSSSQGRGSLTSVGNHSLQLTFSTAGDAGEVNDEAEKKKSFCSKIFKILFSESLRKVTLGFVVTACIASSWAGATHLIKSMFLQESPASISVGTVLPNGTAFGGVRARKEVTVQAKHMVFDAPFFTAWFFASWSGFFFPLYLSCSSCIHQEKPSVRNSLKTIAQTFRDRGITFSKFITRCCFFCFLWVLANYLYIHALRILDCTDVTALFSAHIAFVYLLAWVILHEQFVGIRIVAVILCNTGIALLAYMDGIAETKTLGGVVLAAASAAATAVYKVLFRKLLGEASIGQTSLVFSVMAFLNTILFSPFVAVLYVTGHERIIWDGLPWAHLIVAAVLVFTAHVLSVFSAAITFEFFVTMGLVVAIPVSAALDVQLYSVVFEGMKFGGITLISCGFVLVLFPANWPQYITKVLRWSRHRKRSNIPKQPEPVDYRTGLISRSHLRSPSGLIR